MMDTEIMDQPDQELEKQLEEAVRRIGELEAQAGSLRAEKERAVVDWAVADAVSGSGALDPELLELLLRREDLKLEDGRITGLEETMAALRREKPWLFRDGGDRPRFAAGTHGRALSPDEAAVAVRYKGNPWYKR